LDTEPALGDDLLVAPGAGRLPHSDAAALSPATLFASYHQWIHWYIQSKVHDPAETDDLTQETFLQARWGLESLCDANAVAAWLYRVALHVCYAHFRRSALQPSLKSLDVLGSVGATSLGDRTAEPTLDQAIERTEMSGCVMSFIDNLSGH
jgi:DNA-directed RNA polymerase specialized sigma24 family protein